MAKIVYTIEKNQEFGTKEVAFNGKPCDAVRTFLKEHRFRWHGQKGVWYGYAYVDDLRAELDKYYELVDELPAKKVRAKSAKALLREEMKRREAEYFKEEAEKYRREQLSEDERKAEDEKRAADAEEWATWAFENIDITPDYAEPATELVPDEWGMYEI
jgi:hypothetical protein